MTCKYCDAKPRTSGMFRSSGFAVGIPLSYNEFRRTYISYSGGPPHPYWAINFDEDRYGGVEVKIKYCPRCGRELPMEDQAI